MASELKGGAAPPLTQPHEVVRHAGRAFATDKVYRRVVYINLAFFAAIIVMNYLLVLPRSLEPYAAVLLYFPLAMGQWRFWRLRGLDTKTAVAFVRLHGRAFKDLDPLEKLERPEVVRGDHFRVAVAHPYTLKRAASRATYVYSVSLTLGVIFSTLFLPISLGAQVSLTELALRSTTVAFLTLVAAFTLGWIMPPIWLIDDAGVRYYSRKNQSVEQVSRWYLTLLGPILGVGALGTFFLIYWVAGFTLVEAIIALTQLSLTLYPASLTSTFMYHRFREREAARQVKEALAKDGMEEFPSVLTALVRLPPK